ncbi:alpha/beta fold hydrolase [Ktedonosporobacter rubrisoli]|uniref:Alpha/beta fold hydrolase n=1 Tax=Ktedonosporobacter rubrisoli TaxID=2509675 RepID=A0A4P6K4H2_KTERU|nr:alpha/beta fold hydrolase [Ktedonosporobacter rubrisoli]QBD83094.1 alpha/beta fold hydrolase [Ktedonosporobacter rubrisoli]
MAEFASKTGFLEIQKAPLYYEVAGQGPALLLLHAGVADSRMWDEQFPSFAQHYRALRYDLRGFGKSQYPAAPFANHADPAELLKHLGLAQAHIVAASWGGKIALDFALTHQEMVSSLILVAANIGGYEPPEDEVRFGEQEEQLIASGDLEGATELNLRMWVDGPLRKPEQVNPRVRQRVYDMQYQAFINPVPDGAELLNIDPPANQRLSEIQVPTLIINGDLDTPGMLARAQHLATHIPKAQHVTIAGTAHLPSMEKPEEFLQIVMNFLRERA